MFNHIKQLTTRLFYTIALVVTSAFSAALFAFPAYADQCTVRLSTADVSAFRTASSAILQSLGRQKLSDLLVPTDAAAANAISIDDWLNDQLCPYLLQLSPEVKSEIARQSQLDVWATQANSLFQVLLNAASATYFAQLQDSLEKFKQGLGVTSADNPTYVKAVQAALDRLALIQSNVGYNSALVSPDILRALFGSFQEVPKNIGSEK